MIFTFKRKNVDILNKRLASYKKTLLFSAISFNSIYFKLIFTLD